MSDTRATCYQCSLPLSSLSYGGETSAWEQRFCCYGCYLIHSMTGERGEEGRTQWLYYRLGAAIFLTINIMMFNMALYSEYFYPTEGAQLLHSLIRYLLLALSTPVLVLLGTPLFRSSWQGFKARSINMDMLIVSGVVSAYALSVYVTLTERGEIYFETMAMVLILVTIGRYLEARAKLKASSAIHDLLARSPEECTRVANGEEQRIKASEVHVDDLLKIIPGEIFCVDGIVQHGESSVDESMLTGESKPVFKVVGSRVFSGTANYDGSLLVKATGVGETRTLAKLTRLLEEARLSRAPIERVADRVTAIALPLIILLSIGTFVYWTATGSVEKGLMNALSVLLISCPCALGIATPMAIWLALGEATKKGILVRRAEVLERIAHIRAVAFDKTGTLTERDMHITNVVVHPNGKENTREVLRVAASLESHSEHPLAKSIVRYAHELDIEPVAVEEFRAYPGLGVSGRISNNRTGHAVIGSERLLERMNIALSDQLREEKQRAESNGHSVVCSHNSSQQGLIVLSESLRQSAREAIEALKRLSIHTVVLTGDNRSAAEHLKHTVDVEVKSELLPEDKVREIAGLAKTVGTTTFVGDGINDAPAMNAADVGIAMGCGSDITRESADVNLLGNDLTHVAWLLQLARKTYRVIKLNLIWAFAYNVVLIPVSAGVL
ncbi:MAG: heavy metal translocating P-type ATPase, partial [Bacteroidota bacterium]